MNTGEIRFTPDGKGIRRRTYLADMKGLPPSNLWIDLEKQDIIDKQNMSF